MIAFAIASVFATLTVVLAWKHHPARKRFARADLALQAATKDDVAEVRQIWDRLERSSTTLGLSACLCFIVVLLAVFLPGIQHAVQALPLVAALTAMTVVGITEYQSRIEQGR